VQEAAFEDFPGSVDCPESGRGLPLAFTAAPLAFVVEAAEGAAFTTAEGADTAEGAVSGAGVAAPVGAGSKAASRRLLSVRPTHFGQRAPCFMGSADDATELAAYLNAGGPPL
jgi:fructose-1,6-bisphosphatase